MYKVRQVALLQNNRNPRALGRSVILLALLALLGTSSIARAADSTAIARARRYVEAAKNGPAILNYLHMGARFGGHQFVETRDVQDARRRILPRYFALIYRFKWDKDGVTDVAFLCTPQGKIYDVQVTATNAVLSQPFLTANLAIQVLGNALLESVKNDLTAAQREEFRKILERADAKALLVWAIEATQK